MYRNTSWMADTINDVTWEFDGVDDIHYFNGLVYIEKYTINMSNEKGKLLFYVNAEVSDIGVIPFRYVDKEPS